MVYGEQDGSVFVCGDRNAHLIQICILQMLYEFCGYDAFRADDAEYIVEFFLDFGLLLVVKILKFV